MFLIYLPAKFHIHSSYGPLIVAIKLKAKDRFHATAMLLFYFWKKKIT
jgi:hypothetical protein